MLYFRHSKKRIRSFFVERFGVMFDDCHPGGAPLGFAMDLFSCLATAIIAAQSPTTQSMCTVTLWMTCIFFFVFAIITLIIRPYTAICLNALVSVVSLLQFVSALLQYYAHENNDATLGNWASLVKSAASVVSIVWAALEAVGLVFFLYQRMTSGIEVTDSDDDALQPFVDTEVQ